MDPVAYQAKIDILEKKLVRKTELLESCRALSDERAVKLMAIRERLARLSVSLKEQGHNNEEVREALRALGEIAGLDINIKHPKKNKNGPNF